MGDERPRSGLPVVVERIEGPPVPERPRRPRVEAGEVVQELRRRRPGEAAAGLRAEARRVRARPLVLFLEVVGCPRGAAAAGVAAVEEDAAPTGPRPSVPTAFFLGVPLHGLRINDGTRGLQIYSRAEAIQRPRPVKVRWCGAN